MIMKEKILRDDQSSSKIPLISIITVVFNGEKILEPTIKSVLDQPYKNIRYTIIDGGSTDGTVNLIKKYEDSIEYWISEKDHGIYDAMNKGWAYAEDDSYILFLGAGDRIESLPNLNQYDLSTCVFGNVTIGTERIYNSTADFRIRLGNTLHHQALLINKSIHVNPPFNLKYKAYADYDFNARLYNRGTKFIFDDSFLSYALPGGLTEKFHTQESLSIVRNNFGFLWEIAAKVYYTYQSIKHSKQ